MYKRQLYIHYGLKGDASRMTPARLQTMSLVCTAVIGLIVFAAAIEPPDLLVWINLFAFGGLEAVFLWPIILGLYWNCLLYTSPVKGDYHVLRPARACGSA